MLALHWLEFDQLCLVKKDRKNIKNKAKKAGLSAIKHSKMPTTGNVWGKQTQSRDEFRSWDTLKKKHLRKLERFWKVGRERGRAVDIKKDFSFGTWATVVVRLCGWRRYEMMVKRCNRRGTKGKFTRDSYLIWSYFSFLFLLNMMFVL